LPLFCRSAAQNAQSSTSCSSVCSMGESLKGPSSHSGCSGEQCVCACGRARGTRPAQVRSKISHALIVRLPTGRGGVHSNGGKRICASIVKMVGTESDALLGITEDSPSRRRRATSRRKLDARSSEKNTEHKKHQSNVRGNASDQHGLRQAGSVGTARKASELRARLQRGQVAERATGG
jgi:hypothetical protein